MTCLARVLRADRPGHGGGPAAFAADLADLDRFRPAGRPARVIVVADVRWPARMITALRRRTGWRRPPSRVR